MSPKGTVLSDRLFAAGLLNYQPRRFRLHIKQAVLFSSATLTSQSEITRGETDQSVDRHKTQLIDQNAHRFNLAFQHVSCKERLTRQFQAYLVLTTKILESVHVV